MALRRWRSPPRMSPFCWKDVSYAPTSASISESSPPYGSQTLDVAIPRGPTTKKRPVCVFVHGGSWQRGDKSGGLNRGIDAALARAGFVGASVNYRLSPEVQHPAHAQDVAAAVKWLHDKAETFGGDPERLVLIGHSAGAHLVMQVLSDPRFLREAGLEKPVEAVVKAAVGISGVYNIVRIANTAVYGELVVAPAFGERVGEWRKASIVSVVMKEGKQSPILRIPLALVTAEQDFHFEEDARELEKWLVDAGHKNVRRHVALDKNHFTIIRDLTEDPEDETMAIVKAFVEQVCSDDQ